MELGHGFCLMIALQGHVAAKEYETILQNQMPPIVPFLHHTSSCEDNKTHSLRKIKRGFTKTNQMPFVTSNYQIRTSINLFGGLPGLV